MVLLSCFIGRGAVPYCAVCSCKFRLSARSYGPIFVGMVFNVLLYGIMITQTYLYFNVYRR